MELLRFIAAGSVDDGKSTLIGRLLYDSGSLLRDQVEHLEQPSNRLADGSLNFAMLTDGLRAEREQGITIDVAYKYFHTEKRKFIIADAPGHVQYTRNMVTGASTANLAIILIDARHGVLEQTYRHSFIAAMMGIPHLVVAVNKMDLVEYSQERFEEIKAQYESFAGRLGIHDVEFIPVSAMTGENVVHSSENMPWFEGRPLLKHLETVSVLADENFADPRFPVQYVIRPQSPEYRDYRGYAGQVASGEFKVGDEITVLPSGFTSRIKQIDSQRGSSGHAFAGQAATILLEDEVDVSRGDMIVRSDNVPRASQELDAYICWMDSSILGQRKRYILRHVTSETPVMVQDILHRVNVNALEKERDVAELKLNDIGRISLRSADPVLLDPYRKNRANGSFILIDESTHLTVGAGIFIEEEYL